MGTDIRIFILAAAAFVAFLAVVRRRFRAALAEGRQRLNALPSQVHVSARWNTEYILEGEGPTILISHGVTGGVDQGRWLASVLAPGCRTICVSRFAYLRSSMPEGASAGLQAEAYKELLDHLGLDRVFIMGNSAGGASALRFALDHPERCLGLILVSSVVPGNAKSPPPGPVMKAVFGSDLLYWMTVSLFGGRMLRQFVPRTVLRSLSGPDRRALKEKVFLAALPITNRTRGVLFDTYVSNPSMDMDIPYEGMRPPVLIIHSMDDPSPPYAGACRLAERLPDRELLAFAAGGHLNLGHDDEIAGKVDDFLRRHSCPGPVE